MSSKANAKIEFISGKTKGNTNRKSFFYVQNNIYLYYFSKPLLNVIKTKGMVKIRAANINDLPEILKLVEELAIYENEPDAVTAKLSEYESAFEDSIFEALVAEHNGQILGMTLYYMTFSTWKGKMLYLEDFVVLEAHRKLGIGQLLFDQLIEVAKAKSCKLIKWQVLDWNVPALNFYYKNNAVIEKNWWTGKYWLT